VPQLNVLSFGFPIRILAGLFAVYFALSFLSETIATDVHNALDRMLGWVDSLGPAGGASMRTPPLAYPTTLLQGGG
jgi:hypothetical protein